MKKINISLSFLVFFICCCKKNEVPNSTYCGVKDPSTELDWLRIAIKDRKISSDSILVQKMEMKTFGEIGFLFQYEIKGRNSPKQQYYYTCQGTLICYNLGGVAGTNCGTKLNDIILGEIVYKSY